VPQIFHIDIEKLLSPLSAERPAGESLRYEGTYDRIRDARREDDPNLPQGAWKTELRKAQWKTVESICIEAIGAHSKDLQIAAWLTEAWLNLYSFAGAARGLELMRALCESFWDDLHPAIENGDLEFRMAPLAWLNERVAVSLKLQPITQPDSPGERAYCWADWENASLHENAMQRASAPKKPQADVITTALFQRSVMLTPTPYFRAVAQDVREMLESAARLEEVVDAQALKAAPGLMRLKAVGEAIRGFLESILAHRKELRDEPDETTQSADNVDEFNGDHQVMPIPDGLPVPGRIRDRADAYYLLAEAADFLARTEPHSPTPYLVRRAIAWGSMSLEQLLPELIRNGGELTEIFRLLQIRA
jgi:type VI secretion system protein ImpA